MASDYGTYLAANILNEDRIVNIMPTQLFSSSPVYTNVCQVTYRLLSRALKVHVNIAKE